MLFQLAEHGCPLDDARLNFSPDSKSLILGLSNDASFVSELFLKYDEKGQNV